MAQTITTRINGVKHTYTPHTLRYFVDDAIMMDKFAEYWGLAHAATKRPCEWCPEQTPTRYRYNGSPICQYCVPAYA